MVTSRAQVLSGRGSATGGRGQMTVNIRLMDGAASSEAV